MKRIFQFCIVMLVALPAIGKPLSINFETMMSKSKSILIGTYLGEYVAGKTYHIEVDSVVKGQNKTRIIAVNKAKGVPRLNPGTKVMAFINDQDQWEWLGLSDNFRTGVIRLSGFYDLNAYDVYPDAISLVQMREFMSTGRYSGAVEGNLRFWSFEKHMYEHSDVFFAVTYTYFNCDSITTQYLAGGLKLGAFPSVPDVYFTGGSVLLTYDDNAYRPMQIGGKVDSLKPNGRDYVANFEVWQPMNLSLAQFSRYTTDPSLGQLCYDMAILVNSRPGEAVIGANRHPFVYGEDEGDIGYLMFGDRRIECTQFSIPTDDQQGVIKFGTWSHTEVEIQLDEVSSRVDHDAIRSMPGDRFVNLLKFTELSGEMFVYENGVRVSRGKCFIIVEKTRFTDNANWDNN